VSFNLSNYAVTRSIVQMA